MTDAVNHNPHTPSELHMALLAALETAMNYYVAMDNQAPEKLAHFHGKVIAIEMPAWNLKLFFIPDRSGIQILQHYSGTADTTISGSPMALFKLGNSRDKTAGLRESDICISGDLELGRQFSQFLEQLNIDYEEQLATLCGDVLAHKLGNLARGFEQWRTHAGSTTAHNLAEFFQQESRSLPVAEHVSSFFADIGTLRHDTERLEARIARLSSAEKNPDQVF